MPRYSDRNKRSNGYQGHEIRRNFEHISNHLPPVYSAYPFDGPEQPLPPAAAPPADVPGDFEHGAGLGVQPAGARIDPERHRVFDGQRRPVVGQADDPREVVPEFEGRQLDALAAVLARQGEVVRGELGI